MQHPGLGFPGKVSNHKTCSIKQKELECRKPTLAGWERVSKLVLGREEPQAVRSRDCGALCPSDTKYPCCSAPWRTNTKHQCYQQMLHTCTSSRHRCVSQTPWSLRTRVIKKKRGGELIPTSNSVTLVLTWTFLMISFRSYKLLLGNYRSIGCLALL